MGDLGVHLWAGQSGQKYRYTVYVFGTVPGPGPAIYILALACMKQKRVTHIHARHSDTREEMRRAERSDLIPVWNPPSNPMR